MDTCAVIEVKDEVGELHGLNVKLLTQIRQSLIDKGMSCMEFHKGCAADGFKVQVDKEIISIGMFQFFPLKEGKKRSYLQCHDVYPWYKTFFWSQKKIKAVSNNPSNTLQNMVEILKNIISNNPFYTRVEWLTEDECWHLLEQEQIVKSTCLTL